jgi:hypothetical protein
MAKYISGCLASLSAMIQFELPHINVLTKMDLLEDKKGISKYVVFIRALFIDCVK